MEETKKTKINDMTQGSPLKVLILFAVPIIFSNLLQQLYNIADSVIVGNYLGTDGLAAVGAAGAITSILVNVAFGLSAGASVVISQLYGAKLLKRMKTSATTFIIFSGAVGLIMMTIVIAFAREMLMLINTPESILEEATTYLVIYFIGCVPVFLYNAFNAVYLGLGDSRKPLYFLGIASVMNIGLDLLFVAAFKMGIGGAAWATTISQSVATLLAAIVLPKEFQKVGVGERIPVFKFNELKIIVKYALPTALQSTVISIGNIFVQSTINLFGETVMAGCTAANKVQTLITTIPVNINAAIANFVGQNIGAGKLDRVKRGFWSGVGAGCVIGVILSVAVLIFSPALIRMFIDADNAAGVVEIGTKYLNAIGFSMLLYAFMSTTKGILKGSGDMLWFIISTIADLLVRVILVTGFARSTGEWILWWSLPIGWVVGTIITMARYIQGGWAKKSLVNRGEKL